MQTNSRTVRVFLSSTFRDFAEERDLLVRKVFPELVKRYAADPLMLGKGFAAYVTAMLRTFCAAA